MMKIGILSDIHDLLRPEVLNHLKGCDGAGRWSGRHSVNKHHCGGNCPMKRRMKVVFAAILTLCLLHSTLACADPLTSDIIANANHEPITWELIRMVEHDSALKSLLIQSIEQANAMNPDRNTNPVDSLESYYRFIDWSAIAMPWEISPQTDYVSLYDRIDQSMGCFYFICDQPLDALDDCGYYHNSLMYHEPFRTWLIHFTSEYGALLSTEASWSDAYYQNALANPDFHLDDGTYETPDHWHSFNDFFARRLSDPSMRPIASPEDESVVIAPADSAPQGVWQIDGQGSVIAEEPAEIHGIAIKTGTLKSIASLLEGSAYADAFAGGTMTHTFLDVNDYHRYHFPVSGTVLEAFVIPADDAPGGVITWDAKANRYKEYYSDNYGWQSIETRGVVVLQTESYGLVAIVPVGMCEVGSVNFEESVVPGAQVNKGDPMGYFLFGGSDIIMVFGPEADFSLTAEPSVHLLMGEAYGRLGPQ